ncbi:glutamine amidotransferase [Patescibacteria group bacterium]|nr:glutamine amidotransferase [Patescibacteria group bacterium]
MNDERKNTKIKRKLVLGWLYPRQMSTYGDRGNVLTLWKRAKWRGIELTVREIDLNDQIDPTKFDIYFFGGGQDQSQKKVSEDLIQNKKDGLRKAARLGAVFLGICGGYQLMGTYYRPTTNKELPGIGLLDVVTIAGNKRMIGNIVVEASKNLGIGENKLLVGFENHSGKTFLGKRASALGKVIVGNGNNGEDRTEGAFQGNVFGCYLHGPLLPKNPNFADLLIQRALLRRNQELELPSLQDNLEISTHQKAIERANNV